MSSSIARIEDIALPPRSPCSFFQITREGLMNALKHAQGKRHVDKWVFAMTMTTSSCRSRENGKGIQHEPAGTRRSLRHGDDA